MLLQALQILHIASETVSYAATASSHWHGATRGSTGRVLDTTKDDVMTP
jgi:hypothetical protein